ncbi:MAG: DNA-binding protein [Acidobacteria bacterium]|nr:MAG: DNA-binding protein [Acidobacteriota bacterium]
MRQKVYLESSFVSYLTSRLSPSLIVAGHQLSTKRWWEKRRHFFDLFISPLVLNEIKRGDEEAAKKRVDIVKALPMLAINDQSIELAEALVTETDMPEKAKEDALHIAIATFFEIDFLLTWNCRHIANAQIQEKLKTIITQRGYKMPIIATPEELMGW